MIRVARGWVVRVVSIAVFGVVARALPPGQADPWMVADAAFVQGGTKAALAAIEGATGPDLDALRAYLNVAKPQPALRKIYMPADALVAKREYGKILAAFEKVEVGEKTILDARVWKLRSHAHKQLGQWREAVDATRRWGAIAKRLGWLKAQSDALNREFGIQQIGLRYVELEDIAARLVDVERRRGRREAELGARVDRAALLAELGRVTEAVRDLTELVPVLQEENRTVWECAVRANLAYAQSKQGQFAKALEEADRANRLYATQPGLVKQQAGVRLIEGAILQELGDFEAAERAFRMVEKQLAETPQAFDPYYPAAVPGNLGILAWRRGEFDRAIAMLEQSRERFAKNGDDRSVATARRDLAEVLLDAGRAKEALPHLEAALAGFGDDVLGQGRVLALYADVCLAAGDREAARKHLDAARRIEDLRWDRRTTVRLYEVEARLALAKEEPDAAAALAAVRAAMDTLDDALAGLADDHTYAARAQRAGLFDVAVDAAFRANDPDAILEMLERSRAAVLRESLGSREAVRDALLSAEDAAALRAATEAVVDARLQLVQAHGGISRERVESARAELHRADEKLRELSNKAEQQKKNARLRSAMQTAPASASAIRGGLGPHEAIVYYAVHGSRVSALVVTKEKTVPVRLGTADEIGPRTAAARDSLTSKSGEFDATVPIRILVDPLRLPDGVERVLVCADGAFAELPWPLLFGARYGSNVPSGTTLLLLRESRRKADPGTHVLAFGDPLYAPAEPAATVMRGLSFERLAFAGPELTEIAALDAKNVAFRGKDATEACVRAQLEKKKRWRALHFACHGIVDARFPRRSALVLTAAEPDDGFLTVPEILALPVDADLVVLSACDSGRGQFVRGEGVLGIARAFLGAGASSVVASLWKVEDAPTRSLMVAFHRNLKKKGATPASALRAAQEEIRNDDRWTHPRHWAAWVVWGAPE